MGPTLVQRAFRASVASGRKREIIAVARSGEFPSAVRRIAADVLDPESVKKLPDAPNIIYLVGRKFGSAGNEVMTWATNAMVPVLVGLRYRHSRIVVLSSGNVYPFVQPGSGGAIETTPPAPLGEYAQSVLARERVFEYFAQVDGTRVAIMRLIYAVEPRYGVLVDIAAKILGGTPLDLSMGYVNVIWQGDANSICLRALCHCEAPARVFNLTGDIHSVRDLARRIGERLRRQPVFVGEEADTALLINSGACRELFGAPQTEIAEMIERTARWLEGGGTTLGKPTHFETRNGRF